MFLQLYKTLEKDQFVKQMNRMKMNIEVRTIEKK